VYHQKTGSHGHQTMTQTETKLNNNDRKPITRETLVVTSLTAKPQKPGCNSFNYKPTM